MMSDPRPDSLLANARKQLSLPHDLHGNDANSSVDIFAKLHFAAYPTRYR